MMAVYPINGKTWLICGGRDFSDNDLFSRAMSDIMASFGCPRRVVQGGARGADAMGSAFAKRMAIEQIEVRADWEKHGKAAGAIRNQQMLDDYHPDAVIAFPGGRGTADMIKRARARMIDVIEIRVTA